MEIVIVPEVLATVNHVTPLISRKDFVNFSCHESFRAYTCFNIKKHCTFLQSVLICFVGPILTVNSNYFPV
jgi:hypothetical protein